MEAEPPKYGGELKRLASGFGGTGPPSLQRRASFAGRAIPAFKFSAALEMAAGAKQVERFNLESWRINIKKMLAQSRFGRYYENVLILLSIISCFQYIYMTYLHESIEVDRRQLNYSEKIELAFASVFGLDWILSFLLAEHRVLFLSSFYSIVDLLTVVPILVTYGYKAPEVIRIHTFRDMLLYTAFAMNTTRILRALRIRRKLARIADAVERFMAELVLSIIVMILFFASVMQFLEHHNQPLPYHTWMYYIWVTISTVGYGDITPKSTQGRVAVMCIIGFSIISIPKMTNELIEKMALQSVYMRNTYVPKTKKSQHVVICGDLASTSLDEFFEELFHEDHENVDLSAILLLPSPPTTEMIFLLRDSSFFSNLMYLEGSALVDKDLRRAKAHTAVAIFIMTNKFSAKPDEEDAKSILLNLSIKRYVASFNLPAKLFCLQLIRPQNRRHLAREEGDEMSAQDLVVCLNEIKMGVLAKAVMYPGANTLLMNLISSFSDDPVEADEGNEQAIPMSNDSGKSIQQVSSKAWLEEYQKGCDWEIYTTPLAQVFEGAKFCELSYALYEKVGVVLFALQITDAKVEGASKLLLNPANFIIPSQNLFTIEAFVIAQNKASSDLSFTTQKLDAAQQALKNIEMGFQSLQRVNRNITSLGGLRKTNREVDAAKLEALRTKMGGADSEVKVQPEVKTASSRWKSLKRSNLVAKKVESFSYQEILHQLEDQHMKKEYYLRTLPADFAHCLVKTNVIDEIPFINNHVIIIGKGLNNLFDLIRPLRAKFLGMLRYIVIISPEDIPHDVWSKIAIFDAILVVRGSPLEEANLRRAGIFRAAQVVVLADGSGEARASGVGMEALVDSDAIFSYQLVKRMNAGTQIVVEIVNTSNISYLDTDSSSNVENYKFSQEFAAGNLFTTPLLDSIVCQAYYNPSIIKVLNRLISGVDNVEAAELAAEATARVAAQAGEVAAKKDEPESDSADSDESDTFDTNAVKPAKKVPVKPQGGRSSIIGMNREKVASTKRIKDILGSCLYQMPIPDNFNEKTYGKLFQRLSLQGIVPLGLLRGTFAGMCVGPKANRAPYVYTNPDKDVEIFKCDKIFVLSTKPLQTDSKLDLKDWLLNMQQNKALAAADSSALKRPGSASTNLDSLDIAQKKLDARVGKLSKEMNHKLDGLISTMNKLAAAQNISRSRAPTMGDELDGDEEFYTIDTAGKRRFSVESALSNDSDNPTSTKYNMTRGRGASIETANSVSSTKVMPRSSMKVSINNSSSNDALPTDGVANGDQFNAPAKSQSLSKLMASPGGILRKAAGDSSNISQKKRHSFSNPIATVQVIQPAASSTGGDSSGNESKNSKGDTSANTAANAADSTGRSPGSPTASATAGPLAMSKRNDPPGSDEEGDDDSLQSAEHHKKASPRLASPRSPQTKKDDSPSTPTPTPGAEMSALSFSNDDRTNLESLMEEGKQLDDSEPSFRSLDTDCSTVHGGSSKLGRGFSCDADDELNLQKKDIVRVKPAPPAKTPPLGGSPMFAKKNFMATVPDRATISGPPVEMALSAIKMNQMQIDKNRAASAGRVRKEL